MQSCDHVVKLFEIQLEVTDNFQFGLPPGDSKFSAMAEMVAPTHASTCLDVQIGICMFLQPSDILALRKVCRHLKFSLLKSVMKYFQDS